MFTNIDARPCTWLRSARTWSPTPGGSTLITSAPWSPRMSAAHGPESIADRSTTRMPVRGPLIAHLVGCDVGYSGKVAVNFLAVNYFPVQQPAPAAAALARGGALAG